MHKSPLKVLLISTLVFCLSMDRSYSQGFTDITVLGGYTLDETFFTTDGYEVYISDGATYGGSISYFPTPLYSVSLNYTRQDAKMDVYDYYFSGYVTDVPVSVNNITVGFDGHKPLNEMGTSVFGGVNLGTAGLVPKDSDYSGRWKFDVDLHVGAKIFPSPKVGIRLQTGLNLPIQYFGAAFTIGTGGTGAGVTATGTITQLYFLGGLIFRLQN